MKVNVFNLIILDESGSMSSIEQAATGGLNETVQSIQAAQEKYKGIQEHYVTFVSFNTKGIRTHFENRPVSEVGLINDYRPIAGTPLYDAMGISLTKLRYQLADKKERNQVLITVITDGYENSSREYTGAMIKKLVEELKALGWVFTYIGANQDVDAVAESLSIQNSMRYDYSMQGTREMMQKERNARDRFYCRLAFEAPSIDLQENFFQDEDTEIKQDI
jgi:hypothetical protein